MNDSQYYSSIISLTRAHTIFYKSIFIESNSDILPGISDLRMGKIFCKVLIILY